MKLYSSGRRCPIEPTFIKVPMRNQSMHTRNESLTLVLCAGHMIKSVQSTEQKNQVLTEIKRKITFLEREEVHSHNVYYRLTCISLIVVNILLCLLYKLKFILGMCV